MPTDRFQVRRPEAAIADAVAALRLELGRDPSEREVARLTGIPKSTVHDNFRRGLALLCIRGKDVDDE